MDRPADRPVLSIVHPSDCQSCSENWTGDPCPDHAEDWRYWRDAYLDATDPKDNDTEVSHG